MSRGWPISVSRRVNETEIDCSRVRYVSNLGVGRMGNFLYHVEWERRGGRQPPSAISLGVYRVSKSIGLFCRNVEHSGFVKFRFLEWKLHGSRPFMSAIYILHLGLVTG